MMRVLIDEDTAVQLLEPLRHLLRKHKVDHIATIDWKGKKDRNVLPDARKAGYDVIITRDHNQLSDPAECDAIKRSALHHIRYSQRREGMIGLGLALESIIAAMPMVMDELEQADSQRLVHIVGLDPNRRYELIDPTTEPPNYWPH
jgi:PIN like domain